MDNYLTTPSPSFNDLLISDTLLNDLNFNEILNQLPAENSNNLNQPHNTNTFQFSTSNMSVTHPQNENSSPFQQIPAFQQQNKVLEFSGEVQPSRKRSRNSNNTKASTEKRRKTPLSQSIHSSNKEEQQPQLQSTPFDDLSEDDEDNEDLASLPSNERKKRYKEDKILKNREAAQQFRQRQREHIAALEHKVKELSLLRDQYTTQTQMLEAENKLIRAQVDYLRKFLSQALAVAFSQQLPQLLLAQSASSQTPVPPQVPLHTTLGPIDF